MTTTFIANLRSFTLPQRKEAIQKVTLRARQLGSWRKACEDLGYRYDTLATWKVLDHFGELDGPTATVARPRATLPIEETVSLIASLENFKVALASLSK